MYHDVIPCATAKAKGGTRSRVDKSWSGLNVKGSDDYKISAEQFENQVAFAAELRGKTGQEIIFTFDDGGISAVKTIAPILEKYQFKGIFFIPTAFIEQDGFLSEADINTLHKNGHIIGSHSHSHPTKMNRMPYEDIVKEWQTSSSILSEIISSSIEYASVPGGWYSQKVAEACNEVGIKCLFNSEPTQKTYYVKGCLVSGRFAVREQMNVNSFKNLLTGKGLTRKLMWVRWGLASISKLIY